MRISGQDEPERETVAFLCRTGYSENEISDRKASDIGLLIDTTGTAVKSLLQLAEVYCALETALGKPVDVITISSLEQKAQMPSEEHFREQVRKERVELYAVA